jgi:hypothetical protein
MHQTIISAINGKKLLSLTYDGHHRVVEPHAYGTTKKGNDILRCFQIKGGHSSDKPHDWNLLTVSEITNLSDSVGHFACARHDYKRDDKAMQTIYAQI